MIMAMETSGIFKEDPSATFDKISDLASDTKTILQPECKIEPAVEFICRLCKKSFYNANALQNHKNLQHDTIDGSSSENENYVISNNKISDHNTNIFNFKYIPHAVVNGEGTMKAEGNVRTFLEDTSYIIVKIKGVNEDIEAVKRRRLEGLVKKAQLKPVKPAIDLRGPFTCTFPSTLRTDLQCRQIFFNCCEYSLHYREEHTKRRKAALRCQVCEKRLDRDFYPVNQIAAQLQAPISITFSCRICGYTFLNSAEYDEHNRMFHAKIKPYQCTLCAKRFTQQGGLQQHMRMHTGIRPFGCTFCSKAFTQKAGLDQHLRTHTKIKPFKCVICSKCFSQSVHLRQHMRTHTNIQPFECSVCGRRFKQSSHLNFHMRSHVGEIGSMVEQSYSQGFYTPGHLGFLNFANLQPVQDGDAMYYSAELATETTQHQIPFTFPRTIPALPDSILSL